MLGALPLDGWYYKNDGKTVGPLSQAQVLNLLSMGQLPPEQVIFNRGAERMLFLRANAFQPALASGAAG